ncbi:MAG: hypothetical protein K8S56_05435 [Candidatus Cloacimonetes bacterium]|nr:hypothetical protein [Candidatus Cloacimonadota bacterium]
MPAPWQIVTLAPDRLQETNLQSFKSIVTRVTRWHKIPTSVLLVPKRWHIGDRQEGELRLFALIHEAHNCLYDRQMERPLHVTC